MRRVKWEVVKNKDYLDLFSWSKSYTVEKLQCWGHILKSSFLKFKSIFEKNKSKH
jgi:hypothetical protein